MDSQHLFEIYSRLGLFSRSIDAILNREINMIRLSEIQTKQINALSDGVVSMIKIIEVLLKKDGYPTDDVDELLNSILKRGEDF